MSEIFETIQIMRKNLGPVTAYKYAVQQGYTGTEQEFAELMASYASIAQDVSAESRVAEGYALGKQNGVDVGNQSPYYHANAKYHAEQAAAKAQEAAESAAQAESAITVDPTLIHPGQAADAKAVGDTIGALKNKIKLNADGKITFAQFAYFDHYGLSTSGTFAPAQKYRVSCEEHIVADKPFNVSVSNGFRWGYIPFVGETAGTWSGWKTSDTVIPSGTEFVVQIARVEEDFSEIANVEEFVSAVTFSNPIYAEISDRVSNAIEKAEYAQTETRKLIKLDNDLLSGVEWELGVITETGDYNSNNRLRQIGYISLDSVDSIRFWCDSGYKYYYLLYDEQKTFVSATPFTAAEKNFKINHAESAYIRTVIMRTDSAQMSADEGQHLHGTFSNSLLDIEINQNKILNRVNVVENIFRYNRFFSHIGVDQSSNIIIPSQSLADILRAKRLGFKVIELNVQKTSDGEYVCLHGNGGKFGNQFIGVNGSDVSNTVVSSVTFAWINANVRYVSKYEKYQTAPYALADVLYECKKLGIIPLVQYVDAYMVDMLNKIMGANNYILNIYAQDRESKTDAVCASWTAIADETEAISKCEASGQNYILGVNMSSSVFSEFTDSDWQSYFNTVHDAGYTVCSAYLHPRNVVKYMNMGLDVIASSAQINDIKSGNLCNLSSGGTFSDFETNGTESNGTLTLTAGQTLEPATIMDEVFLGGGSLHIRFEGTIYVNIGKIVTSFTSDGEEDVWVSSYFEEQEPTFRIEAANTVKVYDIIYKASKM